MQFLWSPQLGMTEKLSTAKRGENYSLTEYYTEERGTSQDLSSHPLCPCLQKFWKKVLS